MDRLMDGWIDMCACVFFMKASKTTKEGLAFKQPELFQCRADLQILPHVPLGKSE